jgi:hypothetical protein
MSKEITYRCNLCAEKLDDQNKFVGIYHGHGCIELQAAAQVNNHLCNQCVKNLKAAFAFAER